jgi:hypothetical protein
MLVDSAFSFLDSSFQLLTELVRCRRVRERGSGRERGAKRERGLSFHLIPNIAAAAVVVEVARRVSTDQGAQSEYIARSPVEQT